MSIKDAVGTIVFAEKNGQHYVLTVQRANTNHWNRAIIFGAAGRIEPKETRKEAIAREIKEELKIEKNAILRIIPIGNLPSNAEGYGVGNFYLVEVPFAVLAQAAKRIRQNPKEFEEVRSARIVKARNLGKNKKVIQLHYRAVLPRAQARLIREKMHNRRRIA